MIREHSFVIETPMECSLDRNRGLWVKVLFLNFFCSHADIYKCKECKMRCREAVTMKKGSRTYSR